MEAYYKVDNTTYHFINITVEAGMMLGVCATAPYCGKTAWLDPNGFQLEHCRRVEAKKVEPERNELPYGYTLWGGQLRDTLPHGARWYMNGGRW